jgi:hypothetical protein
MAWRNSPFFRPLLCVAIIVGSLFLLVALLSRPAPTWAALDARCDSLLLPVASAWSFPAPANLSAFWADARLQNLEELSLNGARDPRGELDLTVGSAPAASQPPAFFIKPGSQRTGIALKVAPDTRLSISAGSPARVQWNHSPTGSWSAQLSFFDAEFESSHLAHSPALSGSIRNRTLPATLSLTSRPVPEPQLPAYLAMPAPPSLSWTAPASELPGITALSASGCRLSPLSAASPPSGQIENIEARWRSLRTFSVTLDSSALRVQANGELRSLREAGRELLPSLFEQLARGAPEQRGFLGVAAALLVLAAGIYLKRALEILAKIHLPDPK